MFRNPGCDDNDQSMLSLFQVSRGPSGHSGLYIIAVDFFHAGYYECVARTPLNEDRKGAWLTVIGTSAAVTTE